MPARSTTPTSCCSTSRCPASTGWKPRATSPRSNRARPSCSAPPTTHALSAFEAAAIDYLVKPVRPERLAAALDRARTFAAGRTTNGSGEGIATPDQRRTHLCARLRGSLRLIPIEDVHYLQAEEKYVVVHHARGEDLIEESLKSLEEEFGDRFVRIHRNCLVARHEIVELKRAPDGHVQAVLRHGDHPLEVSRRCVAHLRETVKHL